MKTHTISLTIDSDMTNVALVGVSIHAMSQYLGLDEAGCSDMELSVVEAVNNVITHAYNKLPDKKIEITLRHTAQDYCIEIIDEGQSTNNFSPKPLDFDSNDKDALPEGGMGLAIIYSIMDDVSYSSNHGKNVFSMRKRLL